MGTAQLTVPEQHGDFLRLVCYALGDSHTWDAEWKQYSPAQVRYVMEYFRYFSNVHRTLLRFLPRDGEILEAGAGLGFWVALLNEAGCRARGMDYSDEALERARRSFPELPFDRGDVRELPYPDRSMSGYVSFGVAEHFREGPDDVLREAARVLRPGGVMTLAVPWISPLRHLQHVAGKQDVEGGHFYQYFFEGKEIEERIRSCGFRILGRTHYGAFKTLRDVIRSHRAKPFQTQTADAKGTASVPRVDFKRKLFWYAQNAVFENPLSRRLAGHMILVVAERA